MNLLRGTPRIAKSQLTMSQHDSERDYVVDLPETTYQTLHSPHRDVRVASLFKPPEAQRGSFTPPRLDRYYPTNLEKELRRAAYARCDALTSERRSLKKAFDFFDLDHSGTVDFDEFCRALERFGLHMKESRKGVGGLSRSEAQALFDKYDSDGSGYLSYSEFADALIGKEA